MKYLIILIFVYFNPLNETMTKNRFFYEVEASNGGVNGFSDTKCNCDPVLNRYSLKFSDSGYEKYKTCCEDLPKDVLKLIDFCDKLITQGKNTSGNTSLGGYKLTYDIKNKFNFKYSIVK
jgi:hypothetical protein